jgi:arsenite methyltransferase
MQNNTLNLLEQHHVDGENFKQLMIATAPNRFNDEFWATWNQWIAPVLSEPAVIADFGCGPGSLLNSLRDRYPTAKLIGVECASWMMEDSELRRYELIEHDLQEPNLAIADNSLDAITNIVCIHELSQPITLLQSIHRCLKPGGRCLITDWVRAPLELYMAYEAKDDIFNINHNDLSNLFTHFMEHNRYSNEDVAWLLLQLNFKILDNVTLKNGRFGQWIVEK